MGKLSFPSLFLLILSSEEEGDGILDDRRDTLQIHGSDT